MALNQVNGAIRDYILKGEALKFTRDNSARQNITDNVTQEDMLKIAVKKYVERLNILKEDKKQEKNIAESSIIETLNKYGKEQAEGAIINYITNGDLMGFTRTNDSRENIEKYVGVEQLVNNMSQNMVQEIINREKTTPSATKQYFTGSEFADVEQPQQNVFSKVLNRIKEKQERKKEIPNNAEIQSKSKFKEER